MGIKHTCYNPQKVTVNDDDLVPTPDIVTCVALYTLLVLSTNYKELHDNNAYSGTNQLAYLYRRDGMDAEIYLNTSPCKECFLVAVRFY